LDSVAILGERTGSPEVSQMLVRTVRYDPNPAVRLKAIDGLKSYGGQAEVRQALSEVLLNDDNLGVRTHAVDLLRQHQGPAVAGVLQQVMGKESNDYVRMQCQKMLEEMNASLETF
jgi:HEAT repeat protein